MGKSPDLLVVGAGVFGLWTALHAAGAGMSVMVLERDTPGAGASGGIVGALTPHMPVSWRPLKQFQLDALLALEDAAADLTGETGIDTGYARTGRLSPLISRRARDRAEEHSLAACAVWQGRALFEVLEAPPPAMSGYLPAASCPFGLVHDTLSARITPRPYMDALGMAVGRLADLRLGAGVTAVDADAAEVIVAGDRISAGHVVIAAGWESFPLAPVQQGQGIKGQAALMQATLPAGMPVIQMPGLYVVGHGPGRVAVGSTSEKMWQGEAPDAQLDEVIAHARAVCPALVDAPVIERWAGIRPKAPGREPMIGPVPGHARLSMATGGYKIGLGIAHLAGEALVSTITGATSGPALPTDFLPQVK